jgi:hypothetical protein
VRSGTTPGCCGLASLTGPAGLSAAAEIAFAAAAAIFALGECLLSQTLPAIINDLAPPGAASRYNGLGVLAAAHRPCVRPPGRKYSFGWGPLAHAAHDGLDPFGFKGSKPSCGPASSGGWDPPLGDFRVDMASR